MDRWPPEAGRYQLGSNQSCVAVCTLSSLDIELPMDDISIAGKCVTENIGIEKIIKNIISNPKIRYLVLCGVEPKGHYVGQAFKCLLDKGLDENKKIIGARGAMPFLKNLDKEQLDRFKQQVELVDMIEEEDAAKIASKAKEFNRSNPGAFSGSVRIEEIETINADYDADKEATADSSLDGSFFTILVDKEKIVVEHYTKEKKLNKRIVGTRAEAIAGTIVKLGLVKGLYHAAYLGKELEKAEIALKTGRNYEQDKELEF